MKLENSQRMKENAMPCRHAMIESELITATEETTIQEVLELFNVNKIRSVPVIDKDNNLLGMFNFHQLLVTILPIPEVEEHKMHAMEISLDHMFGQAEWLSDRLQRHLSRTIGEMMIKDPKTVHPNTPIGEGVRLLAQHGSPVAVTEVDNNKLVGLISSQTVIKLLLSFK